MSATLSSEGTSFESPALAGNVLVFKSPSLGVLVILKYLTNFRKTVETSMALHLVIVQFPGG